MCRGAGLGLLRRSEDSRWILMRLTHLGGLGASVVVWLIGLFFGFGFGLVLCHLTLNVGVTVELRHVRTATGRARTCKCKCVSDGDGGDIRRLVGGRSPDFTESVTIGTPMAPNLGLGSVS